LCLRERAHCRTTAVPARAAGLAGDGIHVIGVRYRADRRHAFGVDLARLARVQAKHRKTGVAADELHEETCRTRDLAALAGLHFDVVYDRSDRHRRERHGVAGLHVDLRTRDDRIADAQTLRCQDVGLRTVLVLDQRDERGPVRIVFQTLDSCWSIEIAAAEIDFPVRLLGAAADVTRRDAAIAVAAPVLVLPLDERLERLALPQCRLVDLDQVAASG